MPMAEIGDGGRELFDRGLRAVFGVCGNGLPIAAFQ